MRSQDAVIRVYDEAGTVIETHEHAPAQANTVRLGRVGLGFVGPSNEHLVPPRCDVSQPGIEYGT